jgi:hypothetical protein
LNKEIQIKKQVDQLDQNNENQNSMEVKKHHHKHANFTFKEYLFEFIMLLIYNELSALRMY